MKYFFFLVAFFVLVNLLIGYLGLIGNKNTIKSIPNWNDTNAIYTLKRKNNVYSLLYKSKQMTESFFVGDSRVPLAKFIDKKVSITGHFPENTNDNVSDLQCINSACRSLPLPSNWFGKKNPVPVIDIYTIQEEETK